MRTDCKGLFVDQKTLMFDEGSIAVCGRDSDAYFGMLQHLPLTSEGLYATIRGRADKYKVLLDVGANIGVTAAMMQLLLPDAEVHAFECGVETVGFLRGTAALNGGGIHVHDFGLGAVTGTARFNQTPTLAGSHMVTEHTAASDSANMVVQIRTLDEVIDEVGPPSVDFIKIDVEGAEIDVLEGGKRTLARYRPDVYLEFNSFCLISFRNMNPRDFLAYLRGIFPKVSYWLDGAWKPIVSGFDEHAFIHDNLVRHGCVDDMLCQFE